MTRTFEILGAPFDLAANERGAAEAPAYVRRAYVQRWQRRFEAHLGIVFRDGGDGEGLLAEAATPLEALAAFARDLSARVQRSLAAGHTPIVIGGDHSISVGSVAGAAAYLRAQHGSDATLGLLWIDAHADLNTDDDGNLHGRAAAILLGHGPTELTGLAGFSPAVQPAHLIEVGVQEVMPSEMALIREAGVRVRSISHVEREGLHDTMVDAVRELEQATDAFTLSVDIDAAAGESFGACAAPMVGGLSAREMCVAVESAAASSRFLGMDLVEYCPGLDLSGNTGRLVCNLLHAALGYTRRI